MAKRQLPPTFTLREVQTTTRPRATSGTLIATISSVFSDALAERERLVKRTKIDMEEEGPSGSGKVLSQHPLEYKEDEEESEGEAYLLNSEEERMEEWLGLNSCGNCGGMVTHPFDQLPTFDYYFGETYGCSTFCRQRIADKCKQEACAHRQWFLDSEACSPFLQDWD